MLWTTIIDELSNVNSTRIFAYIYLVGPCSLSLQRLYSYVIVSVSAVFCWVVPARAGGSTPRTSRSGEGGLTHAQGPHVAYEKKIFGSRALSFSGPLLSVSVEFCLFVGLLVRERSALADPYC